MKEITSHQVFWTWRNYADDKQVTKSSFKMKTRPMLVGLIIPLFCFLFNQLNQFSPELGLSPGNGAWAELRPWADLTSLLLVGATTPQAHWEPLSRESIFGGEQREIP